MTLLLALGASAAAVVLVWPLTRGLGRAAGWPLALLYLLGFAALVPQAATVFRGEPGTSATITWVPQRGWSLTFVAEPIGIFFALLALGIGAIVLLYSTAYLDKHPPAEAGTVPAHHSPPPGTRLATAPGYGFYQLITMFTLSMVMLVLTDSLSVLFVAWELTSLASFGLIVNSGRPAFRTATRTLSATFIGGLSLLAAIGLIWDNTGTDSISAALAHPVWQQRPGLLTAAAVLVAVAALSKSAQWPFHYWLPGAMAAITPVSAYLHAAAVVKAGIFLLIRFSPAFHDVTAWRVVLVTIGLGTAVMAALFALQKFDLKQLMAYSTVSQLGWIIAAIGVGTDTAIVAAAVHTFAHALFKSGLFMLVGVLDHQTHTRDIRELRRIPGRVRAMPWTFTATAIGAAGMAGIPPLLGFVSKEGMLAAFLSVDDAPLRIFAVAAATLGGMLTFAYCARILWGGFIDTDARVHADSAAASTSGAAAHSTAAHRVSEAPARLLLPAALPAVAGLPVALWLSPLNGPADAIGAAAVPGSHPHTHLALWHGLVPELGLSLLIIAVGCVLAALRRPIEGLLRRELLPISGDQCADTARDNTISLGRRLAALTASDSPSRHVAALLSTLIGLGVIGAVALFGTQSGGIATWPALDTNLNRNSDWLILAVMVIAVVGMCISASRIAAVVLLSAVGIAVTVQMFSLGAPDVGLTQLMVEAITVIVFMLVLRRLPATFTPPSRTRRWGGLVLALAVGVASTLATLALTSRRERTELSSYLFANTEEITGGKNVVNVILVEFRALDTFGELSVLGMAGIAILAVMSSLRSVQRDPHDAATVAVAAFNRRGQGAAAAALQSAERNAMPLRLMTPFSATVLFVVSALLFLRGHNSPGGGFIAALVAAAGVVLIYLSRPTDRPVSKPLTGPRIIGIGLLAAGITGFAGLFWGTFLEPAHVDIFGQHISSAMLFDVGVFFAVLGLVMVMLNLLGTGRLRPHPGTDPANMIASIQGGDEDAEPVVTTEPITEEVP